MNEVNSTLRKDLVAGRYAQLGARCKAGLDADPGDPLLLFYLGMALEGLGDQRGAIDRLSAACEAGGTVEMMAQLARLLSMRRDDAGAVKWADRASALGPTTALDCDTIGCVYARLGRHAEAALAFKTAVAVEPENQQFRYNLATAIEFVGDETAIDHHEAILTRDPDFARSHLAIALAADNEGAQSRVDRIARALVRTTDLDAALLLHAAAAKELERLNCHDRAFDHLRSGKGRHRARIAYDASRDEAMFAALEAAFAVPNFFAGDGLTENQPIFVVGMPRSGTTLVERMLTAHPFVAPAGELQAMPLSVKLQSRVRSRTMLDPETIKALSTASPAMLGRIYLKRAAAHVDVTCRFVDKLPMNFLYTGFIARAFPNATILCLRRQPLDVLWSNYKHLFARSTPMFDYSYDVCDCARYIIGFERLIAFWHCLMPGRIIDIKYESLVAQPKGQIQRILEQMGLPWSDDCVEFDKNATPVATPSAAQVRRPISASSVSAWLNYAEHLRPAHDLFTEAGIISN